MSACIDTDDVPLVPARDLTPAERIVRQLECHVGRLRGPWGITWHALERYIERVCPDLSYEDAATRLAEVCRGAAYTGEATREGHDVWASGRLRFVVAADSSDRSGRPALVTLYADGEAGAPATRVLRRGGRQRGKGERVPRRVAAYALRDAQDEGDMRDVLDGGD